MDLSKLSSDLPLSEPVSKNSVDQVNRELSNEFKIGARSIAALYRLSNTKTALLNASGYLECVDDVLSMINNETVSDLYELKQFLETKKSELTGKKSAQTEKKTDDLSWKKSSQQQLSIDSNEKRLSSGVPAVEFTMKSNSPFHFPLSKIPIGARPQVKYRNHIHKSHSHIHVYNGHPLHKLHETSNAKQNNATSTQTNSSKIHRHMSDTSEGSNTMSSSDNDSEVILEGDNASDSEPTFCTNDRCAKRKVLPPNRHLKKSKVDR